MGYDSQHSPGAQGHDAKLRAAIAKLEQSHADMMGNEANPDFDERNQQEDVTSRLYDEQAPKDYANRKITGYPRGKNSGRVRRGDQGGMEY